MDVAFALSVIFTGVTIVFIVLIVLIVLMMGMGKVLGGTGKQTPPAQPMKPAADPVRAPSNAVAKPAPKMVVEDGVGDETVAVIAAAVAAFTGGVGQVLSVRKASARGKASGRSAWSLAGLRENTKPF